MHGSGLLLSLFLSKFSNAKHAWALPRVVLISISKMGGLEGGGECLTLSKRKTLSSHEMIGQPVQNLKCYLKSSLGWFLKGLKSFS
jgi:hypothetical protein